MEINLSDQKLYLTKLDIQNRILELDINGFWSSKFLEELKEFVPEIQDKINKLRGDSFFALLDLTSFKPPSKEAKPIFLEGLQALLDANCKAVVELHDEEGLSRLTMDGIFKGVNIPRKSFTAYSDAMGWIRNFGNGKSTTQKQQKKRKNNKNRSSKKTSNQKKNQASKKKKSSLNSSSNRNSTRSNR